MEAFDDYWGKSSVHRQHHNLCCHCADVAACGMEMLASNRLGLQGIAAELQMPPELFAAWWQFGLLIHDIGKFARPFQALLRGKRVSGPCSHVNFGRQWMLDYWNNDPEFEDDADYIMELMHPFIAHHGYLHIDAPDRQFGREASKAAQQWMLESLAYSGLQLPELLTWHHSHRGRLKLCSWYIAGFAVLADWLGSREEFFPYQERWTKSYFTQVQPQAAAAAHELPGLGEGSQIGSLCEIFPYLSTPTPMQHCLSSLRLAAGPNLVICEDLTGSGKTEAAVLLAHRLLNEQHCSRVIFALPTQATANSIYQRLSHCYRQFFAGEQSTLMLVHGARRLNHDFISSLSSSESETPGEDRSLISSFLAQNLKTSLLADFVVCTIDQVLPAVLHMSRHQALRVLSLRKSVLIVDEVHSYDPYTSSLLGQLLELQALAGGSAVLLSATLSAAARRSLQQAFARGAELNSGPECADPAAEPFPLISALSAEGVSQHPLPARSRLLDVAFVHDEQAAAEICRQSAQRGSCVCWIRNTVQEAIDSSRRLEEQGAEVLLFHSRFMAGDRRRIEEEVMRLFGRHSGPAERRGRILVATQVVEQSLDLDFDVMISDLAPAELLVQRAGRLHRHARASDGRLLEQGEDARPLGTFYVHCPVFSEHPEEAGYFADFRGTCCVYPDWEQLWRTQRFLTQHHKLDIVREGREFIEQSLAGSGSKRHFPQADQKLKLQQQDMLNEATQCVDDYKEGYVQRLQRLVKDFAQTRWGARRLPAVLMRADAAGDCIPALGSLALSTVSISSAMYSKIVRELPQLMLAAEQIKELRGYKLGETLFLRLSPAVYSAKFGLEIRHEFTD